MIDYEFQRSVRNWLGDNFPPIDLATLQLLLTEEVGELSRAIAKRAVGIRGTQEEWDQEIYKEIGDVLLALLHVTSEMGFDIELVVHDRWQTIRQRNYVTDPQQHGIGKDAT